MLGLSSDTTSTEPSVGWTVNGDGDGFGVGATLGAVEGDGDGFGVGATLGAVEGDGDGLDVGTTLGAVEGDGDGLDVGVEVVRNVGVHVGAVTGIFVGPRVGARVKMVGVKSSLGWLFDIAIMKVLKRLKLMDPRPDAGSHPGAA